MTYRRQYESCPLYPVSLYPVSLIPYPLAFECGQSNLGDLEAEKLQVGGRKIYWLFDVADWESGQPR